MRLRHLLFSLPLLVGAPLVAPDIASAQGLQLFAALFGGEEVGGGDPDGYGAAAITFHDSSEVCFGIVVDRLDEPTLAHIHAEKAGVNGSVFVTLSPPAAGNPGASSGCVAITATQYRALRNSPSNFYVNVHTIKFPNGAIRGQLH
jgi:hypothetical protein